MNSNTELGFLLLVPVFEIALHKPFGEILEKKICDVEWHRKCFVNLAWNDFFMAGWDNVVLIFLFGEFSHRFANFATYKSLLRAKVT